MTRLGELVLLTTGSLARSSFKQRGADTVTWTGGESERMNECGQRDESKEEKSAGGDRGNEESVLAFFWGGFSAADLKKRRIRKFQQRAKDAATFNNMFTVMP